MADDTGTASIFLERKRLDVASRLRGVNLSALAHRSGVSRWTLQRLRDGKNMPSARTLDAVDAALWAMENEQSGGRVTLPLPLA